MDLEFTRGKNVIVGRNNAGKSNVIKALNIVLGENAPAYKKSENITASDFYSWKNGETHMFSEEMHIVCILKRDANEELNFEEINKCFGYNKVLTYKPSWANPDQDVEKRFELEFNSETLASDLKEVFLPDNDEQDPTSPKYIEAKRWIDSKLNNHRKFEDELSNKYEFAFVFRAKKNADHEIEKDLRLLYRENENADWILSLKASVRNELLQSAIIHSFRDPQSQLRLNSYSWYGKLMRRLTENHGQHEELKSANEQVKKVAIEIFKTAKTAIQTSSLNVAFPNAEIHFQFSEDLKTDIYKDCKIYIDDGIKSPLSEKGSGIQSATIIGLFNLYVSKYNTKTSALLCVEEPELYLHPHARRVISDRLDDFLDGEKNQVIITTHSAEFIRTTQEELNMILVTNTGSESCAKSINIKEYKDILLDNNHNEVFFADKVIICEGYDDYILRWFAAERYPEILDGENISIITAAGKSNIPKFAKLIISLGIECFIFADFDFFLRDGDSAKLAQYNKTNNKNIEHLTEKFFAQECIGGTKGKKMLSNIQSFRAKLKKSKEELFYTAKTTDEFDELKESIDEGLSKLRQKGVGILPCEIEDLFTDNDILSSRGKFDLHSVFKLNKRIKIDGELITELIETSYIDEFLITVMNIGD